MIYPELKNFLIQTSDPAMVEVFDNAVEVFEKLSFDDYLVVYETAVGDYSASGDQAVLDVLVKRTEEMIGSLLTMHGIALVSTVTLSESIAIMDSLCRVNEFEDKNTILLALESAQSDQEIFASVVSTVSSMDPDNVLAMIDTVDSSLITRMRELFVEPAIELIPDTELINKCLREYGKYKVVFSNELHWTDRFIKQSEAIGLPFENYAKLYMATQLKADMSNDDNDAFRAIAINLIGIACLSREGSISVQQNARAYLEHMYPEMDKLTRLDMKLSSLLLEYNRAQT